MGVYTLYAAGNRCTNGNGCSYLKVTITLHQRLFKCLLKKSDHGKMPFDMGLVHDPRCKQPLRMNWLGAFSLVCKAALP